MIRGLLHVRAGEGRRVFALWMVGLAYAAAVNLGDNVAQSLFAARVGAEALSQMFLVKGLFDVVAAALYLPLARRRRPGAVLRVALVVYAFTLIAGRVAAGRGGDAGVYGLFIGHECAGTILTIHWGVYILDLFDAEQARRLFPVIFTAARVGGIVGGLTLARLAGPLGASSLLFVGAGLALAASLFATARVLVPHHLAFDAAHDPTRRDDADLLEGDAGWGAPVGRLLSSWRRSWQSPLVRAIAVSTVAMVFLRYGLKLLSLHALDLRFDGDEDRVARFLGTYSSWANGIAIACGLLLVPRLLARFGVGLVNVTYAVATAVAYGVLAFAPSLGAAVGARFVDVELKDALKTPLSALFYGAEPPGRRPHARAFIFGAVIPAATVGTALLFQLATRLHGVRLLVWTGLGVAGLFVLASVWQNHAYRNRLTEKISEARGDQDRGPAA